LMGPAPGREFLTRTSPSRARRRGSISSNTKGVPRRIVRCQPRFERQAWWRDRLAAGRDLPQRPGRVRPGLAASVRTPAERRPRPGNLGTVPGVSQGRSVRGPAAEAAPAIPGGPHCFCASAAKALGDPLGRCLLKLRSRHLSWACTLSLSSLFEDRQIVFLSVQSFSCFTNQTNAIGRSARPPCGGTFAYSPTAAAANRRFNSYRPDRFALTALGPQLAQGCMARFAPPTACFQSFDESLPGVDPRAASSGPSRMQACRSRFDGTSRPFVIEPGQIFQFRERACRFRGVPALAMPGGGQGRRGGGRSRGGAGTWMGTVRHGGGWAGGGCGGEGGGGGGCVCVEGGADAVRAGGRGGGVRRQPGVGEVEGRGRGDGGCGGGGGRRGGLGAAG